MVVLLQGDDKPGDFVGMVSRKNLTALLEQHGPECEDIDLTPRVEVRMWQA